jgi:hypothetical protein
MFIESEHLRVQDSYTAEEITGILLLLAIKQNYIKRENLTDKGEMLVTQAEKHDSSVECH